MRDYSFGNFISALRERRGLSQYQLGALVGVSDKAVSKWENGASTPRLGTIRKLAEILEVSVDELLTCEYATFDRERKDLFAMKNEIINIAKNKLKELYGDKPPVKIINRFKQEELMLTGQEMLLWIGFFGNLQEKLDKENMYFDVRGAQMGASFIAWLVNNMSVNPLPAHYYCPVCKKVEFVADVKCGIDLPSKKCSCGECYQKDGFGVDAVNMYPLLKWNEIYVSKHTTELVRKYLYEYFEGYGVVKEICINYDGIIVYSDEQCNITKYGIFTKDMSSKYPDDIIMLRPEEYSKLLNEIVVLTIIENEEEYLCSRDLMNMEFSEQQIKLYFDSAVEKGIFKGHSGDENMKNVISDMKHPKFSDLLSLFGFLQGAGAWEGNAEILYDKGIPLSDLISCREDVYSYLYDKLNEKCCENPSGLVYEIKEAVRRGKYTNNRMPIEIENLLLECDVPEWYVESMKKILYLFPKTHIVMTLKREICRCVKEKTYE